jgi:fructose-1,6-bisphosphatase/inositol monophosphatase family enzyme
MTRVDEDAEDAFADSIEKDFNDEVILWGEESINTSINLDNEERPCILVDMIDGTDLLERGFSNWCSAIVIFTPTNKRINGAYVALQSENRTYMYYALGHEDNAFKIEYTQKTDGKVSFGQEIKLKGPAIDKLLKDASVCSYGQKSGNLLELLKLNNKHKLIQILNNNEANEVKFRFYNLAGNPMMAKLAEGIVDVVFDIKGQAPHDVVPGAFIAMKAGASLWDIEEGKSLSDSSLVMKLLHPGGSRIKYVLAANQNMVTEMTGLLEEEWNRVERRTATVDRRQRWARPPQIQTPLPGPGP